VSENKTLRVTSGLKRKEVTEGWTKLHNQGFVIYTLHHILTEIKSRINSRVVHVACNGEIRNPYKNLDGNHLGDISVSGKATS
jgi:hypothetical protein